MNEIILLVEEAPEGGYTTGAPGHQIFTEADTLEQLKEAAQEAVFCHFEEGKAPHVTWLHGDKQKALREETLAFENI